VVRNFVKGILIAGLVAALAYFFVIYMPKAFAGDVVINPIALHLGILELRWYGILIAGAVLFSYVICLKLAAQKGLSSEKMESLIFFVVLGGLLGARAGFIVQNISEHTSDPSNMIAIYNGGLSIHGGLLGGIIAGLLAGKKMKIDLFKYMSIVAPFVLLSGAIGRFGNFFNQEIIGRPTNFFMKMYVAPSYRPIGFEDVNFFHPVFLYESILLLGLFCLYFFVLRKKMQDNFAISYTLVAYSVARIVVEPFRIDYKPIFLKLDLAQVVSIVVILLGIIFYFWEMRSLRQQKADN